jgi:hypothetical protein
VVASAASSPLTFMSADCTCPPTRFHERLSKLLPGTARPEYFAQHVGPVGHQPVDAKIE